MRNIREIMIGNGYFEPSEVRRAKAIAAERFISRLNSLVIRPDKGADPRIQRFTALHLIQGAVDETIQGNGPVEVWKRELLLPEGYRTGVYTINRESPSQIASLRRLFDFVKDGPNSAMSATLDSIDYTFKETGT